MSSAPPLRARSQRASIGDQTIMSRYATGGPGRWQSVRTKRVQKTDAHSFFSAVDASRAVIGITHDAMNNGQDLTAQQISNNTFCRGDLETNSLQNDPNRYCE
jgi:hypothetical protein